MKKFLSGLFLLLIVCELNAQTIRDTAALRANINSVIVPNGTITASKLNTILNGVVTLMSSGNSVVSTVAALRAMTNLQPNVAIITNDLNNGVWKVRTGDVSSVDNGYTLLVTADGKRIERIYTGGLDARWAGVVGDGVTNNTTALQALINFAGATNQEIYLPDGVYLTDKLTLVSNLKIRGQSREGTRIKQKTSPAVLDAYSAVFYGGGINNLKLENFTIDANQNNFGDGSGLSSTRGANRPLYILNLAAACGNYTFNNMKFINGSSVTVLGYSNPISNVSFDKCIIDSMGNSGISPGGVINFKFTNSEIRGWGYKDTTTGQNVNSCAIFFTGFKCDNVFFDNNRCTNAKNLQTFAISDYGAYGGVVNSTFSNNIFQGNTAGGSGISMLVENTIFNNNVHIGSGTFLDDGYEIAGNNVKIINNVVTNGGFSLNSGYLYGKAYSDGWIVSGNQISFTSNNLVNQQPVMYIGGDPSFPMKNVLLSNNIIDASKAAIYVPGIIIGAVSQLNDAHDITIFNNSIKVSDHSQAPCIDFRGLDTLYNINISKNNFYGTTAIKVSYPAIVGNISITDNDFSKLTATLSGTDSTFFVGSGGTGVMDSRYKVTGNTYKTNLKALSLSKNTFIMSGTGAPETVITGNPGSSYIDEATGNNYRKSTGTGNTGWSLQVNGAITKLALPLSFRIIDSTVIADTVSTSKTGVLLAGYRTNSGDTLATKADVRAGGGGGGGGTTATPLNRVAWVDSLGNDATAKVGNILLPFQTIQRALDSTAAGGTVNVGNGTFLLSAALRIKSNQSLRGGTSTTIKKNSAFTHMIVNDACYRNDGTLDSNIIIDKIILDANGFGGSTGRASATANGNIQMTYAKYIQISNIDIGHNDAGVFSTHFQNVSNMKISNIKVISSKDGLHFNNGCRNIVVDGAYLDTYDDAIAVLADDYSTYQNSADSIENITFQNITIDTLINRTPTGFAVRILTGSWLAYANGNTYQAGNYVTNGGKIYKVSNSGTFTGSVAPTHTTGVVTGADGIAWRFLNIGTQLYTTVNNIKLINVRINGTRIITRTLNNDSFDYGVYPGTSGGVVNGLYFTNVTSSNSTAFVDVDTTALITKNSNITTRGSTVKKLFTNLYGNQQARDRFYVNTRLDIGSGLDNINNPDSSSIFNATSLTKGILIPRMTNAQMLAIPVAGAVDAGLMISNIDSAYRTFIYSGTGWKGLTYQNESQWQNQTYGIAYAAGPVHIGTDFTNTTGSLNLSRGGGQIRFYNAAGNTDEKTWDILPTFGTWNLRLLNDAGVAATLPAMTFTRTGGTFNSMYVGSALSYNDVTKVFKVGTAYYDDVSKFMSVKSVGSAGQYTALASQSTGSVYAGMDLYSDNGSGLAMQGIFGLTNSSSSSGDLGANSVFAHATGTGGVHLVASNASGIISFTTGGNTTGNRRMTIDQNGKISIGNFAATATLHLPAGTATAGTAPQKFTSGPVLTTPENGAVEYDGANYWVTSGGIRYLLSRSTTGTAAPTTTPAAVGLEFIDTTNKKIYKSTGTASSADWTILN